MPTTPAALVASKPGAKPGASAAGGVVDAIASAITGQPMNGTVNGRKGFQPGNKFGSRAHKNQKVAAAKAAHTSAHGIVRSHVRAKTIQTPAGRSALKASASAARELQAARAEHQVATRTAKNAAARDKRAAASAARVRKSADATGEMMTRGAHERIEAIRRGAVAGSHDGDAIIGHVDRLARGVNSRELHEAAKRAGVAVEGRRKRDAVDAIKNHVYDAKLAADEARAASMAKVRNAATKDEKIAHGLAARRVELERQAAAHQTPTGRPPFTASPKAAVALPRPFVPLTPRSAEQPRGSRGATSAAEPSRRPSPSLREAAAAAGWSNRAEHERLAAEHIDRHASAPTPQLVPGRREMELMRTFKHDGVNIHFTHSDDGRRKAVNALRGLIAAEHIPAHIAGHTKDVYLTTGEAQHDRTGMVMPGARVAGVANGKAVAIYGADYHDDRHSVLAHELSHNYARGLYGGRTTPTPESDFARAATSGEAPVSRYGATSLREDFATSFQAYFANKGKFRQNHPERFAVIDRLVKDPAYKG